MIVIGGDVQTFPVVISNNNIIYVIVIVHMKSEMQQKYKDGRRNI